MSLVFVGALWFLLGGALQTAAMNRGMMLAGRFIGGFAIGQLSFLAPLYQTEIGKSRAPTWSPVYALICCSP